MILLSLMMMRFVNNGVNHVDVAMDVIVDCDVFIVVDVEVVC